MGTTNFTKTPAVTGGSIQFGAEDVRRMALDVFVTEGILELGDLAVSQRAAGANMSVDVAPGAAIIKGDDADGDQGKYYARLLDAETLNVTVTAADASNPRIDRVVLEIKDSDYDGSGLRIARIRTVDGTPTAGANAATNTSGIGTMPDSAIELARLTVGAGVTTIVDANIVNRRTMASVINASGVQALTATGSISATGGKIVTFIGAASQTLTLPAAVIGMEYEIFNIDSSDAVTLARAGTDTFKDGATTSLVIPAGGSVKVRCLARGTWYQEWPRGQQLSSGYAQAVTDSSGNGDKLSFTVVGDGSTPVRLTAHTHVGAAGSGQTLDLKIRDGAGGTGTAFKRVLDIAQGASPSYAAPLDADVTIAAFTGSKTFYMNVISSGTASCNDATWGTTRRLRAEWAPGSATS